MTNIEDFVSFMIEEGFYRYKPPKGLSIMFDGFTGWSYLEYAKTRNLIIGQKKDGTPKYLDLNTIDMNRKDFPIITKLIYDTNQSFGKINNEPVFNTAKLLNVNSQIKGTDNDQNVSIFWNHLDYLCGDVSQEIKEWVKDWLCDIFQDPNNKKGTSLVFIGSQGCGKSIFFDNLMSALLGEYFHYNDGRDYGERFNLELKDKLLINFDEGFATKSKATEAKLKSFITQSKFKIQSKGRDSITIFNPARAVFTTNSRYAINTANDDRRFAIFRTAKKDFITPEYFDCFMEAINNKEMLEKFIFELQTRKITSRLNIPPMTEEKKSQKVFSADKVSEWFEFIINTPRNYTSSLNNNIQSGFNNNGYLWNHYEENERSMFKDNGLKSFLEYRGKNDDIDTTNKLFSALKVYLEDHKEWRITSETQRIKAKNQFILNKDHLHQRMWIFTKSPPTEAA